LIKSSIGLGATEGGNLEFQCIFAVVLLLQFLNHSKNGDRDREQCRVAWHSPLLATSLALAACMTASSPPCRALEKKTGALCSLSCFFSLARLLCSLLLSVRAMAIARAPCLRMGSQL
jgi:hypothetical protein